MTQNKVAFYKAMNENANTKMANAIKDKDVGIKKDLGYKRFGTDIAKTALSGVGDIAKVIALANDPEWYKRVPNVAEPLAKAQFFNAVGMQQDLGTDPSTNGNDHSLYMSVPSYAVLHWIPSVGSRLRGQKVSGETEVKPVAKNSFTINAKKELAKLVSKSGIFSSGIDPQDIYAAFMCEIDLWCYIHFLKNIAKCVSMYSEENKTMPRYLISAILGVSNPISETEVARLQRKILDLESGINALIDGANSIKLPASMTLLQRRLMLTDAIVYDDDTRFAQWYTFKQDAYLKWTDTIVVEGQHTIVSDQVWVLNSQYHTYTGTIDVDNLLDTGVELLNALVSSSDITQINGALIRYYDQGAFYSEPHFYLKEAGPLLGFTDPLTSAQIRNTKFVGPVNSNNNGICLLEYSNTGGTYYQRMAILATPYTWQVNGLTTKSTILLDSKSDVVSEDEFIDMTRNVGWVHRVPVDDGNGGTTWKYYAYGSTEVFTVMSITSAGRLNIVDNMSDPNLLFEDDSHIRIDFYNSQVYYHDIGSVGADYQPLLLTFVTTQFKNCPFGMYRTFANGYYSVVWVGDAVHNTCAVDPSAIAKLHDACVYSEIYLD